MKRLGLWMGMWGFLVISAGCNSNSRFNFNIERRYVTIRTEPPGAEIFQIKKPSNSMTLLGTSPIEEQPVIVISEITKMENMSLGQAEDLLRSAGNVVVMIKKDGCETYNGVLKTDPKETLSHTITLSPQQK